jgi:predicted phage-related endonuclease
MSAGKSGISADRRSFIGGSDARIIMGSDDAALVQLWREKRGEIEPEDLSGNLVVQLGLATEELNRRWYEASSGQVVTDIQKTVRHPALRWMATTLDGRIEGSDAVFEAKFMLPWSFSEEAAAEKYANATGCQRGDRPWRPGQAVQIRRHQLRSPRGGG